MGYVELVLIFVLAFVVIGPKEFPRLMMRVGAFVRHLKNASQNFYAHFDQETEDPFDPKRLV